MSLLIGVSAHAAGNAHEPSPAGRAGPVRVGEAFNALPSRASFELEPALSLGDCRYYTGGLLPAGVAMMVVGGTVVRFDLDTARSAGPFGLRVGQVRANARREMPQGTRLERGFRFGETRHLVWHSASLAVRAELTPDHRIDHLSWGRRDAVEQTEACL